MGLCVYSEEITTFLASWYYIKQRDLFYTTISINI